MEIVMKENGKKVNRMEKVFIVGQMELYMKAILKKITKMDMA